MHDRSDEILMRDYVSGDIQAFEILYGKYKGQLYRYFFRQTNSKEIAQELFQDVWIKIINARSNYEPTAKFSTFIYRVAHNHLIDYFRKSNNDALQKTDTSKSLDTYCGQPCNNPEKTNQDRQNATMIIEQIEKLPEEQREAIVLKLGSDMSTKEIATITGVSAEAAKSRIRYAMSKIKRILGDKS